MRFKWAVLDNKWRFAVEPRERTRRLHKKALKRLESDSSRPRLTTTESLVVLEAECGAAKLHRILEKRGLARRLQWPDKGYKFALPAKYGGGTISIKNHRSFHWSPKGIAFISSTLRGRYCSHGSRRLDAMVVGANSCWIFRVRIGLPSSPISSMKVASFMC